MRKNILKATVWIITFILVFMLMGLLMNRGNTDTSAKMAAATLPLLYVERNGELINLMRGYLKPMDESTMREHITPLEEGRRLNLVLERMGVNVRSMSFELRSVDGSRLVEATQVTSMNPIGGTIRVGLGLKDLIEEYKEYTLVFIIEDEDGREIRYYTRVIMAPDYPIDEELDFVREFHTKLFDKEQARDLTTYMESNALGDNSTYARVDIHSSFQQLTWGTLEVKEVMEPIVNISELGPSVANMKLGFIVSTGAGSRLTNYRVTEYYRVRRSSERIFLLNYERQMGQIFESEGPAAFANNKIMLGVTLPEVDMEESDDGNVLAFVNENRIFSYNVIENRFVNLYGFYDNENFDRRTLYNGGGIKILSVDEGGNVRFMVYGYMNRGRHEGENGIAVFYYNSMLDVIEEEAFIPDKRGAEMIEHDVRQLSYVDSGGRLYLLLHGDVYEINLESKLYNPIVSGLTNDSYRISKGGRMIAYISDEGLRGREITYTNLGSKKTVTVTEGGGQSMIPLGFMGEDLIYGVVRDSDVVYSDLGEVFRPMYRVCIKNENNETLKNYMMDGIYVSDAVIKDNQISLKRMVRNHSTGTYHQITDDQILNNDAGLPMDNTIESAVTEGYETIIQIGVKNTINKRKLEILHPKEVLYEGGREINIKVNDDGVDYYDVYGIKKLETRETNPAKAVELAEENSCVVLDEMGNYLWKPGGRSVRNQIMAIEEDAAGEERPSLAVCLDTILSYEGIPRNTRFLLDRGDKAADILRDNLPDHSVLELYGCSLSSVLYYVDRDLPVLAATGNDSYMLIIGYNELNTIVMDPGSGRIYRMGMNDSRNLFEEYGNKFLTYVRY